MNEPIQGAPDGDIVVTKHYIHRPVGRAEIQALVALSEAEERAFFERNPLLVRSYRRRLIGVALCQGAALQYVGAGYGVNDFDVHFFYAQNPAKPRLSRAVKRVFATVGAFKEVPVDFIRTVIPVGAASQFQLNPDRIRAFLRESPTSNAKHLSRKAVVGLMPAAIVGRVLWRPKTSQNMASNGGAT